MSVDVVHPIMVHLIMVHPIMVDPILGVFIRPHGKKRMASNPGYAALASESRLRRNQVQKISFF